MPGKPKKKKTKAKKNKGIVLVSPVEMLKPSASIKEARQRIEKLKGFHGERVALARKAAGEQLLTGKLVLDQPTWKSLSWSPQYAQGSERLMVIRTLLKHGYDVRVLSPQREELKKTYKEFLARAKKTGAKQVQTMEKDRQLIEFVADHQTSIKGRVFVVPEAREDYYKRLGIKKKATRSRAGESGMVALGNKFVLVSPEMDKTGARELKGRGLTVYKLPHAYNVTRYEYWPGRPMPKMMTEDYHIDRYINVVPRAKAIIVDPGYYSQNQGLIKEIAKKEGHKVVVIPAREAELMPANLLRLPDGKILFNRVPELVKLLKKLGLKEGDYLMLPKKLRFNPKYMNASLGCFASHVKG